jgi:flagellar biosynthesis component FlhA
VERVHTILKVMMASVGVVMPEISSMDSMTMLPVTENVSVDWVPIEEKVSVATLRLAPVNTAHK